TSASLLTTSGELLMTPVTLLMTSAGSYHKPRAYVSSVTSQPSDPARPPRGSPTGCGSSP
uniref:hypothetical protein n=1 Tax=Prevotella sp. TaxID=59823 RepID=UPI0040272A9B